MTWARRPWLPLIGSLTLMTGTSAGCASDAVDAAEDGQRVTTGSPCVLVSRVSGKAMTPEEIGRLNDPIAKAIFGQKDCPITLTSISERLNAVDKCDNGAAPRLTTRLIGEETQQLGRPVGYRGVTARECAFDKKKPDGRTNHGSFISLLGVAPGNAALPEGFVELIGQDRVRGVFNFYSRENPDRKPEEGQWQFFGSSEDFVTSGYECKRGACLPKVAHETRCAACHPGGGLNMKELHNPWVFWDTGFLPGAGDVFKAHPKVMGERGFGQDLEVKVLAGNAVWTAARVRLLKKKGTQELLRPLFCTIAINLQTSLDESGILKDVPPGTFNDAPGFLRIVTDSGAYGRLLGVTKSTLPTGKTDTPFSFIVPQRSSEDSAYHDELVEQNLIDEEFVSDVLDVDFTRAIFSDTRCNLLQFAPDLPEGEMTAAAIREGFTKKLAGATLEGAAALLRNLMSPGTEDTRRKHQSDFIAACNARPKAEMTADALTYASHLRNLAKGNRILERRDGNENGIIEFPATMPTDIVTNDPDRDGIVRFRPEDCTLERR